VFEIGSGEKPVLAHPNPDVQYGPGLFGFQEANNS